VAVYMLAKPQLIIMENTIQDIAPLSNLASVLESGQFAIAAELSPPRGVDLGRIARDAQTLRGYADAVNVTDNQAASVRMASIPVAALLLKHGIEPVMQMTCRDRNRLAIQADLLGASALGIRNVLCLSGDHGIWGDHPEAKNVYDLDSIHLVRMVRNMTEHGLLDNGRSISPAPRFFIGAASNPFAPPYDFRSVRLGKKVAAGARFVQTQLIYNVERFRTFMSRVRERGLHEKVHILAGVGPVKSVGQASFMASKVAGMEVPQEIVDRMAKTPKAAQPEEGIRICAEIIEQVQEIPGVAGVHIMAVHWAEAVPEIVRRVGLYPRPSRTPTSSPLIEEMDLSDRIAAPQLTREVGGAGGGGT
jgi:methylenetetrahydrofolate reductase (NADPH)